MDLIGLYPGQEAGKPLFRGLCKGRYLRRRIAALLTR
jgi:hypothetical protein